MVSLSRLATGVVLDVSPRKALSASFRHSAVLSSAALSTESFGPPNVSEIFDIFNAPVKLRGRVNSDGPLKALDPVSAARAMPRAGPLHSRGPYSDALGLPWSLPPPVTFDGPACPPHIPPSTLQRRRQHRQNLIHSLRAIHASPVASRSALTSRSVPLYQLFDGPSRISCYQYPTSRNEQYSFRYFLRSLCLSGTLGWLALKEAPDLQQKKS